MLYVPNSISAGALPQTYLAPFPRYGDLLSKNCQFFLPLSHASSLPRFPLEFRAEVNHEETRVTGLSYSEDPVIVAWVVFAWYQRVADGQTDGRTVRQTDRFTVANTALSIASYADAL